MLRSSVSKSSVSKSWRPTFIGVLAVLLSLQVLGVPTRATAVVPDQQVVGWGDNRSGQMTPPPAAKSGVAAISAGSFHSLALKQDGTVVAWGAGTGPELTGFNQGQAMVPAGLDHVTAIAGGGFHSLALKDDGTVVAWGANDSGQATVPNGLATVTAIAAGLAHSLALKQDGTVVTWGSGADGLSPVPSGLQNVTAIAAGTRHSLALKSDGTVVAWGKNDYEQSTVPTGLSNVVAITAGTYYSLALKRDGTVVAWGRSSVTDQVPAGLSDVTAIAGGGQFALALKRDGSVVAWGNNGSQQSTVPSEAMNGVTAIDAGELHALALRYTPVTPGRPTITSVAAGDGQATVSFQAGAPGYPAPAYTVEATPASGGTTVTAVATDGTGTVTGLTNGTAYTFVVVAANGTGSAPSVPSGPVTVGVAPSISGAPPAATVGTAYSYAFTVDGAPAPMTEVTAGALPAGLMLSTDGRLTGTPTMAGTSSFTVTATNALGSASTPVTLTVAPKAAPKADLALTVTATTSASARTITYTLTVTNKGPAAATRIGTVAMLAKGTGFVSATGTPARAGSRILLWRADSIAVNASLSYTATVKYAQSGSRTLVAVTGSTQTPDPSLANNAAAVTTR